MTRSTIPCLLLLLAAGCSGPSPREPDNSTGAANGNLQAVVEGDMTAVRLKLAEERIVQLERQVGELENKPEKLDLNLLTQRVEQLEARVYARGDAPMPASPARRDEPRPAPSPSPTAGRFNPFGL